LISQKHDREKMSYGKIEKLCNNPLVTRQTIGRIHKTRGKWMPKSDKILLALGVVELIRKPKKLIDAKQDEILWRLKNRESEK